MAASRVLLVFALCVPSVAFSQAESIVEPSRGGLLDLSRNWARNSHLGDLRAREMEGDDIELRFWEGYGLAGTRGIIARRTAGRWEVWHARVRQCTLYLPIAARETINDSTRDHYRRQALSECGRPRPDTIGAAVVITADTVVLTPQSLPASPSDAWRDIVSAGVLRLPPRVPRTWQMLDGHHYVIEVRHGNSYRASVIEHVSVPEAEGDHLVQAVAKVIHRHFGRVEYHAPAP